MREGRLALILGGARSGKSRFGLQWGEKIPGKRAFIATCQPLDAEMEARVFAHRKSRDASWETVEEFDHLGDRIMKIRDRYQVLLVDCLTLWLSNRVLKEAGEREIKKEIANLIEALSETRIPVALISNEVGLGIVPETPLGRRFRDLNGFLNQEIASISHEVFLVAAGIALQMK
jgi:adenosylcobinamide kinase/adenosylcobinamide-phosphate guanylyltransferase